MEPQSQEALPIILVNKRLNKPQSASVSANQYLHLKQEWGDGVPPRRLQSREVMQKIQCTQPLYWLFNYTLLFHIMSEFLCGVGPDNQIHSFLSIISGY